MLDDNWNIVKKCDSKSEPDNFTKKGNCQTSKGHNTYNLNVDHHMLPYNFTTTQEETFWNQFIINANKIQKIVNIIIMCIRNAYNNAKLSNAAYTSHPNFFSSLLHDKSLYKNTECFIWWSKRTPRQDINRKILNN